jgi:hypothetical protein
MVNTAASGARDVKSNQGAGRKGTGNRAAMQKLNRDVRIRALSIEAVAASQ